MAARTHAYLAAALAFWVGNLSSNAFSLDLQSLIKQGNFQELSKKITGAIRDSNLSEAEKMIVLSSIRINPRILGGEKTSIKDNPWQVALINGGAPEPLRYQFCGGSIVSENWILTAAHCVDNNFIGRNPSNVNIVAGTTYYEGGGQRIKVKNIIINPSWNKATLDNDFALLQLEESVSSGRHIELISQDENLSPETEVWVSGWGKISEGGESSKELLGAKLPIVSNEECNKVPVYNNRITESMVCAGIRSGGLDSCQGDSGGPLVKGFGSNPILVGVVSWGEGCGRKDIYGVYAKISKYTNWIRQTIALK